MIRRAIFAAALLLGTGASAIAQTGNRQWIALADGESRAVAGTTYTAHGAVQAVAILSSEVATVAVVDGTLTAGDVSAKSGEALVSPLDGKGTRRFGYDAQRLAATLPPEWLASAKPSLDRIALAQKRARFWGRLEAVNLNASAPLAPQLEAVRASYLSNPTVAGLRREAQGNPQTLAALTAKKFAEAVAARDAGAVADLIDPKPFTDTGADAANWQAARAAFAAKLAGDPALAAAMASAPAAVASDQTAFDAGGYRIHLTPRDRAMFVSSVEAL